MHTKTTTVLAIIAIVMAVALVTSSSLAASAIAVKKHTGAKVQAVVQQEQVNSLAA